MIDRMFFMTAGLMTLSVTSVDSGFHFEAADKSVTIPRWLPYAVLAALAVASAVVGAVYPEAIGPEPIGGLVD